jgi:hypothetical protein
MTARLGPSPHEYLCKEKTLGPGAPRLPGARATDRFMADGRGGFSFGGHRLSSLYRPFRLVEKWFTLGYSLVFSLLKYSNSDPTGVTAPERCA